MANDVLLEVKDLKTYFFLDEGTVKAVDGADLIMERGGTLGVVGESGCGKSVTAFSILQLVERPGRLVSGQILYHRQAGNGQTEIMDLARIKTEQPADPQHSRRRDRHDLPGADDLP